jgi:hypothetical protein
MYRATWILTAYGVRALWGLTSDSVCSATARGRLNYPAPPRLDFRQLLFALQAPLLGGVCRLSGSTFLGRLRHRLHHIHQAREGFDAVHVLATVFLGFDDQDTIAGDAVVVQRQQARFDVVGQG